MTKLKGLRYIISKLVVAFYPNSIKTTFNPIQTTLLSTLIEEIIKTPDDGQKKLEVIEFIILLCHVNVSAYFSAAWLSSDPIKTKIFSDLFKEMVNISDDEQKQLFTNITCYLKRYEVLFSLLVETIGTINDSSQKAEAIICIHKKFPSFTNKLRILAETISNESKIVF